MDILLYVLDSLRPDFLGCYGNDRETSQAIDSLARDGIVFENAYSPATWTKAAAASLLTGYYPHAIAMENTFDVLDETVPLLSEYLKNAGFQTVGTTANTFISDKFGFERGYDAYVDIQDTLERTDRLTQDGLAGDSLPVPHSEDLNQALFDLADETARDRFLFSWAVDTHDPYFVRGDQSYYGNDTETYVPVGEMNSFVAEHGMEALVSIYRDMIRHNDEQLGELVNWLRANDRYKESLIIITADHGESFGEHGLLGHTEIVYEEQIRVPLILKLPGQEHAGTRVKSLASLVDLLPTLLSAAGIDPPDDVHGRDLSETFDSGGNGDSYDERVIRAETAMEPGLTDTRSIAYRYQNYKRLEVDYPPLTDVDSLLDVVGRVRSLPNRLQFRSPKIFNLETDPDEMNPLSATREPAQMRQCREKLDKRITSQRKTVHHSTWEPTEDEQTETEDRLRHLGYIE